MEFVVDGERTPGIELVEQLLTHGRTHEGELTKEIAEQAIDALEHLKLPYLVTELIEGGEQFAGQVHSKATRGLQEIVQNADDQAALQIRFAYRRTRNAHQLLVAHDGNPVELRDVINMAYPLLSGSRADPEKIGRFGVGLKTLNRFGRRLAVHCPPLPGFVIHDGRIKRVPPERAIRGLWDPEERETLFVLNLEDQAFDYQFFLRWLNGWDASSLLFVRHLRSVSLRKLPARKASVEVSVTAGRAQHVDLTLGGVESAEVVEIKDGASSRAWSRYTVRCKRPKRLGARNKALADVVQLGIAVPRRPDAGRLFVGLPLEEASDLPFSLNAPFEPNGDRTQIQDEDRLNEWLITKLAEVAAAVAIHRFERDPKTAWKTVALPYEVAGQPGWTRERFTAFINKQRRLVKARVALDTTRLSDFVYESEQFDGLLSPEDVERLYAAGSVQRGARRAMPPKWRDGRRWRDVLQSFDPGGLLPPWRALRVLDWPEADISPKGEAWLVELACAALGAGLDDQLDETPCLQLDGDASRYAPAEIQERGLLVVERRAETGALVDALGMGHRLAPAFRARNKSAKAVRAWLVERDVLHAKATDVEALRTLSNAELETPIDLTDKPDVLRRIRNSLEQLTPDERAEVGPAVGMNIRLAGYSYQKSERVAELVRPAEAYLPSAIDKNEGWPSAAAQTAGIKWLDRRYSDLLKGARGRGALATLRTLGAATAPRLVPAPEPTADPNAPGLYRGNLSAQQKEELDEYRDATGLKDDWVSPDLDAVVADVIRSRPIPMRRSRAHALFLALHRSWEEDYAERSHAQAVHHYYQWQRDGDVSATWVARLASEPWLTTQETSFKAAAPRDLTVLTPAAVNLQGERAELYVREIDADFVDSPVVEALRIEGRPSAHSILTSLEELRDAGDPKSSLTERQAQRCYDALSSYCPGGTYADQNDIPARVMRAAFAGKRGPGLVLVGGEWRKPDDVRTGPYLDDALPAVHDAPYLWTALGIRPPTIADCVRVMLAVKTRDEASPASEIRVLRRLLELVSGNRGAKKALAEFPLRVYGGWANRSRPIYAVSYPLLAEALGRTTPTWRPPLPLPELAPLTSLLGVTVLDSESFEANIPSHLTASGASLEPEVVAAIDSLKEYLAINQPTIYSRVARDRWDSLRGVEMIAGGGWSIRVRVGAKKLELTTRVYLFEQPARLCLLHEDEIGERDSAGLAVATYLLGNEAPSELLSTLALAWADCYRTRSDARAGVDLDDPAAQSQSHDPEPAPETGLLGRARGRRIRHRGRRGQTAKGAKGTPSARHLVDLETLDLRTVAGSFLEGKRRGTLKMKTPAKLKSPTRPADGQRHDTGGVGGADHRGYTDREREDAAYLIVEAILGRERDLKLVDIRNEDNAGADAYDDRKDIWIELKAHGRDLPDSLRLEPPEAERAKEKKGHYWLVPVWDLEAPRTPRFAVIPDPVRRLDVYSARGLALTGIRSLAEETT
jgi:hypothetical protein